MKKDLEEMKDELAKWLHYRRDLLDKWKPINVRAIHAAESKKRLKKFNDVILQDIFDQK